MARLLSETGAAMNDWTTRHRYPLGMFGLTVLGVGLIVAHYS